MLCLLLFSNKGIDNACNYHTYYLADDLAHLENSPSNANWDFENSQNIFQGLTENTCSAKKRRPHESSSRFSSEGQSLCQWLPQLHLNEQSRINLFLIYHFSLSLWQVFLQ